MGAAAPIPTGAAFHGIGSQISGKWKGVVDLPAGNYLFHVLADDGVRLRVNGQLVLDEWQIQADRFTAAASGLGGPTTIEVEWYQNVGGKALELWWQPTTIAPAVTVQPADQSVLEGAAVTFTTAASGDPTPTVQWQSSTDGGHTFTDVPGATSPTLSLVAQPPTTAPSTGPCSPTMPAGQPTTTTLTNPATLTVTTGPAPGAWQTLGGYVTADPVAVVDPANPAGLYVFVRGGDNALYFQHSNDGVNWSGFTRAGGYITSAPYAVADTAGVSGAVGGLRVRPRRRQRLVRRASRRWRLAGIPASGRRAHVIPGCYHDLDRPLGRRTRWRCRPLRTAPFRRRVVAMAGLRRLPELGPLARGRRCRASTPSSPDATMASTSGL